MIFRKKIGLNFKVILVILLIVALYLLDTRTLLIRGLLKAGLYKTEIPKKAAASKFIPEGLIFQSQDGELINLSEQKGKVLFINFWATWCPPCRAEMPSINSLYSKITDKDKIVFMMVDADNKINESVAFMEKHDYELPVYVPVSSIPKEVFNGILPTTLIIGPEGNIIFEHEGVASYDSKEVLTLLNTLVL